MPRNVEPVISVETVEREIASRAHTLAFAPAIESAFERAGRAERARTMIATGIAAIILYDLFLVSDWLTLQDMFPFMLVARLAVFTPAILCLAIFASIFARSTLPGWVLEILGAAGAVLGVLLPMTALVFSESPFRLSYQYGSLLVMLFATVVQRLRFRFALVGLALMFAIQVVTTHLSGAFSPETYVAVVVFFATAGALLALATYILEHAERRSFLFALHGKLLRDQIEAAARTDPLTGLFNRRHLADLTGEIWAAAGSEPRVVSAILLDIDHFKAFNDSRGHLEGDACLRAISACVTKVVAGRGGLIFRFGGEEILILLPGVAPDAAARTAEAVRAAIEAAAIPHPVLGAGRVVTASLGVACALAPETKGDDLIAAADTALYAAKHAGRNRVYPPAAPAAGRGGGTRLAA